MRWKLIIGVVVGFWLWFYAPRLIGAEGISIKARPQAGMVPMTLDLTITLEQDIRNRELCLAWNMAGDPPEFTTSSCYEITNPDTARRTHTFRKTIREPGEWFYVGAVRKNDGSWIRTPPLTVLAAGGH